MSTRAVREKTPNFVDRAMGELCGIYASVVTLPPAAADPATVFPVSYTHLTLPTILLV